MTSGKVGIGGRSCRRIAMLVCILATGCSSLNDPNVPEPIRMFHEPEHGGEYLLYRPSSYNREQSWPLVVVCHSSFPDSPAKRIRAWTQLAEESGFLVVAPELTGVKETWPVRVDRQMALQRNDERHILNTMGHVRAGNNISEDRMFIHGFAGGAYAALHTGLRHPELFRAVTLLQPKFEERYLEDVAAVVDPHQPILVNNSIADVVTGRHGKHCVEWLRSRSVHLTEESGASTLSTDSRRDVEFLEDVLRTVPWIRLRALPVSGNEPLAVRFTLRCSTAPARYRWEFGDGKESTLKEPTHVYAEPGDYRVRLTIEDSNGRQQHRTMTLRVSQAAIVAGAAFQGCCD